MVIFHSYVSLPEGIVKLNVLPEVQNYPTSLASFRGQKNTSWLVVLTPLKNMKVSWGYYSQCMEK